MMICWTGSLQNVRQRTVALLFLQCVLILQQLIDHQTEAQRTIKTMQIGHDEGLHVRPIDIEQLMDEAHHLFSNPPNAQMDLFGYWKAHELTGHGISPDPWDFHFGIDVEKNTFKISPPNTTESWIGEYSYSDATSVKTVDIKYSSGGHNNRLQNTTSYGIMLVTNVSFYLAFAEGGFPYRPVRFHPDATVKVFIGKKLNYPEQIHLAYGADPQTQMTVMWVTDYAAGTTVQYGLSPGNYQFQATGNWTTYSYKKYTSGAIHTVFLNGLKPNTQYYYRCGDNSAGWSEEYSFQTATTAQEVEVVVYGDLNLQGAWADDRTFAESISTLHYVNNFEKSSSFILNVGDIAYCNGKSKCWDTFFKYMQSMIAHKPMMVCQGNHDAQPEPYGYRNRFVMPSIDRSEPLRDYFYSFDVGPIHFVAYSTELWFLPYNTTMNVTQQMEWLENDLIEANEPTNRQKRPWIIAFGHRPLYCTSSWPDCTDQVSLTLLRNLEPLFNKYGVDMVIAGHIHSMERTYPISFDGVVAGNYTKPEGTVHIGAGMAGQGFLGPWEDKVPPPWNGFRYHVHGYSTIKATATTLEFAFIANNGTIMDTFTLEEPFLGSYYYDLLEENYY